VSDKGSVALRKIDSDTPALFDLKAENERFRRALKQIALTYNYGPGDIAREALAVNSGPREPAHESGCPMHPEAVGHLSICLCEESDGGQSG
jgi:hypothetical protein